MKNLKKILDLRFGLACILIYLLTFNAYAQHRKGDVDREKANHPVNKNNKNVNINVDKSKHVEVNNNNNRKIVVRENKYRPYNRPPYSYGGRRFYSYNSYVYHPYRPFSWGPVWHPWGFFATTLAATAIIVSVENKPYHYDQGVYYVPSNGGYTVVPAPIGATIITLPPNTQTIVIHDNVKNYYYGGTYYEQTSKGYIVVPPYAGAIVDNLPAGVKEEKIGTQTYMKLGETYYQPIKLNGAEKYEVVKIDISK